MWLCVVFCLYDSVHVYMCMYFVLFRAAELASLLPACQQYSNGFDLPIDFSMQQLRLGITIKYVFCTVICQSVI